MSKQEASNQQSLIEDLLPSEAETENVKGGPECANNLKQLGIGLHSLAESHP